METKKKIMKYIVIAAVLLIPIMYSFFYLKAYWDPYGNLQDIKIAMVNLDKGKDGENQGQKLVNTMVENGTFNICEVSEDDAQNGLVDGEYYAVISIPETFTEDLNSAKEEEKQISKITYSPNQKTNFLASQIINSAIKTIEINLQAEVAKTVTETLQDKLNEVPDSLEEIQDGAGQIKDGTQALAEGTDTLKDGTQTLNDNYTKFDDGVQSAYQGSISLDEGISTLKNGSSSLISGVGTLAEGTKTLDNGATDLNNGATALKTGANELEGYLKELSVGITNIKNGYVSLDDGIDKVVNSLNTIKTKLSGLSSQATQLTTLKTSNATALNTLKTKNSAILTNYNTNFKTLLSNKNLESVTDTDIATVKTQITAKYTALGTSEATQIAGVYAGLLQTWRDTYVGNLSLIKLTEGNSEAVNTILTLLQSEDLKTLTSEETKTQLEALKTGSDTMTQTLKTLEENVNKIYQGSQKLSTGAKDLANGTNDLKQGTTSLVSGVGTLGNGGETLVSGINSLKQGSQTLKEGLGTLASSSTEVKQGINTLNDGTQTLREGVQTLKEGAETFKTEIDNGLQDTRAELTKLNGLPEFTENPVEIVEEDYGKIEQYGIAFTPLFISIGLWVGALMAYVVLYYDQEKRFKLLGKYAENKFLQIALYFGIAILQGIITGALLKVGLGINPTNVALYYFVTIFISIVFMSIIQFLIMNFGDVGKFLALVILVLQLAASGGTFPIQTVAKGFQALNPILPMTYSIKLVKETVVSQDAGFVANNVGILLLYAIIPLVITIVVQVIKNKNKSENEK